MSASEANVCPRCANGRPICVDFKPDGSQYSHEETCARYAWADDVCDACAPLLESTVDIAEYWKALTGADWERGSRPDGPNT